jgi:hypothetical protein
MAQDRDRWRALVNMVMNLGFWHHGVKLVITFIYITLINIVQFKMCHSILSISMDMFQYLHLWEQQKESFIINIEDGAYCPWTAS